MPAREHRVFAALYDVIGRRAERGAMGARRRELLREASGRTLEIGAGTGANLPHYPELPALILVEPDGAMRRRLAPRAAAARFPVEVLDAPAERLPIADASVDVVVSTGVLCSVDDPPARPGRGAAGAAAGRSPAVHRARPRRGPRRALAGPARPSGGA